MTEATWTEDTKAPSIDWHMSASLENVSRGAGELPEVTSLERAVRDWLQLDEAHRDVAVLTLERPVPVEGAAGERFRGTAIAGLAARLPGDA